MRNLGKFWKFVLNILKFLTNVWPYHVTRIDCPTEMSTERPSSAYEANSRGVARPDTSRTSSLSDTIQARKCHADGIARRERNVRGARGWHAGHLPRWSALRLTLRPLFASQLNWHFMEASCAITAEAISARSGSAAARRWLNDEVLARAVGAGRIGPQTNVAP